MDRSGLTKRQSGIVVINRPEHQLPIAVITMAAQNPYAQGSGAANAGGASGSLAAGGSEPVDFSRRILHAAFHPKDDVIAIAATSTLAR